MQILPPFLILYVYCVAQGCAVATVSPKSSDSSWVVLERTHR